MRYASYLGPADRNSPYGGLSFYGIHCVDLMVHFHGADVESVYAVESPAGGAPSNVTATCTYSDSTAVTLGLIGDGAHHFQMWAVGRKGVVSAAQEDRDNFEKGMRRLVPVLRGDAEPLVTELEMLRAVQVCEAIELSLQRGSAVDPRTLT